MTNSTIKLCAREIEEIAESLAAIRGLLENPDDPLLKNYLSITEPALHQLEKQLLSIAQTLLKQE
jgi:hypothetical protein